MRLATICLAIALLAAISAAAQESLPATHVARLDILEPHANAGTVGGVAILAVDRSTGFAQLRVSVAPPDDHPEVCDVYYRTDAGDVQLSQLSFKNNSSTLITTLPYFNDIVLGAVDSGHIWLRVTRKSGHSPYVEGPLVTALSAVAPDPAGEEVVPPVGGTDGTGHCGLTYDPSSKSFRYSAWWLDLSGPATAARLRRAPKGSNGPVVFEFPLTPGFDQSIGVWDAPSAELRNAVANGEIYFEVTTAAFPDGELRGQIYPVEVFTAAIQPSNEVPPVTGSAASGSAFLVITAHGTPEVFNKLQGVIGDLSGPIDAAHIHRGAIGVNAPPAVTLDHPSPVTIDLELASGSAGGALSNDIVADIRATRTYVNVHTAAFGSGEARGQLIPALTRLAPSASDVPFEGARLPGFTALYHHDRRAISIEVAAPVAADRISLYTSDGRLARAASYADGSPCEISTADLPPGPYFVRAEWKGAPLDGARPVMVLP